MLRALLAKRAIVKSAFGCLYRDAEGGKWHLQSDALIPAVAAFHTAHRAIRQRPEDLPEAVYKWTERRLVFKFPANSDGSGALVAKGFLLKHPRQRLKSYRYGLEETANLLMAAQRGVSVPAIYGYGVLYGKSRLPNANFLLLECLSDYELVGDLLEKAKGNPAECRAILMRTIPTFVSLYRAGCNHIDIHTKTILMHKDADLPPKILDFHYVRFHDRPSLEVLAFGAGFFVRHMVDYVDEEVIAFWCSSLLGEIGVVDSRERDGVFEKIDMYRNVTFSRKASKGIV